MGVHEGVGSHAAACNLRGQVSGFVTLDCELWFRPKSRTAGECQADCRGPEDVSCIADQAARGDEEAATILASIEQEGV